MDLRHFYPEIAFDGWDVEAFPVVGDDNLVFANIVLELTEVLPLDIDENRFPVIESDCCYLIRPCIQARSLNIQVGGRFPELWEDSPGLIGGQAFTKVSWVVTGQVFQGFLDPSF